MSDSKIFLSGIGSGSGNMDRHSIILSTRIGLARNLSNFKFPSSSSVEEKNQIIKIIRDSIAKIDELFDFHYHRLSSLTKVQRQILLDDYQVDDDLCEVFPLARILLPLLK